MGLDMTYIAGEDRLSFRQSQTDVEVTEVLARRKEYEEDIRIIFDVSDFGELTPVKRTVLLNAVNHLLAEIKSAPQVLPYIYGTKVEIPSGSGQYSTGGGVICGLKIDNNIYDLECGLEKCELARKCRDEAGIVHECESEDVRHLKTIKTDDNSFFGNVTIVKKRAATKLKRSLEELRLFLCRTNVHVIQKILE